MNDLMSRYKKYDKRTQEWMSKMIKDLTDEIGTIPNSYVVQLDLMADAFNIYTQATEEIQQNGILITGRQGDKVKNPAVSLLNSSQLFISKLLGSFALTRTAKARLSKALSEESECGIDEYV